MAKIFVVEDDALHVFLIQRILGTAGHEVYIIKDVLGFKEEIRDIQPDLIIMDLSLPYRGGMALIHELRQTTGISQIPVVIVTARSLTGLGIQIAELGCLGFVSKPFLPEKLRQTINEALLVVA